MKRHIIRTLLAILNSRWLNCSPCRYGFIGNVDAFDMDNLRSEVRQRPQLTVAELIAEAEHFLSCMVDGERKGNGLTVITPDGYREATDEDIEDLRNLN